MSSMHIRLRLVIISHEKVLVTYNSERDYYYFLGGHLDYGETIKDGCIREVKEECGQDTEFEFEKILYISEFIQEDIQKHSVELFILGKINKYEKLEKYYDPEHGTRNWSTWLDLHNLPNNLLPTEIKDRLLPDYLKNFPTPGQYIGRTK